jgi:hypothetical protein
MEYLNFSGLTILSNNSRSPLSLTILTIYNIWTFPPKNAILSTDNKSGDKLTQKHNPNLLECVMGGVTRKAKKRKPLRGIYTPLEAFVFGEVI